MKPDRSLAHRLIAPVEVFVRQALEACSDPATPLLAGQLDPATRRPLRLPDGSGGEIVPCNVANQFNFLRVLQGLSALLGDSAFRDRALAILRYTLRHSRRRGMILWGNHAAVDLLTRKPVFLSVKGKVHELKAHYPPYDLMWEADPEALSTYIPYCWHGHLYDWSRLDFSRHGRMDLPDYPLPADPWGADYAGGETFFIGGGLTFLNAGSDLYYSAASLARLRKDPRPLLWADRLNRCYIRTRHPATGMGGYQYSSIFDKHDPARKRSADRACLQFRDQFPEHNPLDGTLATPGFMRMITGASALCRFHLAKALPGEGGTAFGRAAADDIEAYAAHTYDFEDNTFHPGFTDGFRLTGVTIQKDGYYGPAGHRFEAKPADWLSFWSHLAAWRFSRSSLAWSVARNIGLHKGLGDIGAAPGAKPALLLPEQASGELVFGLLELDLAFPAAGFLPAASAAAELLLRDHYRNGWFVGGDHAVTGIDRAEPLALLHVAARLAGLSDALVPYFTNFALDVRCGWVREDFDSRYPT
jgi:pectate lyase